jgi:DNA-binding GntR family transcriptional regulator
MSEMKRMDDLDHEFHNMILSFYDNYFLKKISLNIMEHTERIKMFSLGKKLESRILESQDEHVKLIDLLLAGKIEEAEKILYIHLEKAQIYYLKILIV